MRRVFLGWRRLPFQNYIAALRALGLAVERDDPARCDALLLPGGGDVHPRFYGRRSARAVDVDEARDEFELALFRRFAAAHKPVFGVCRGLQLVNVALGGTLRRHIDGHSRIAGEDTTHDVRVDDPLLRALYGERFRVNSAHHQAAEQLGAGLRATAWAADGTIEALRHDTLPIFAVQWHPERLGDAGLTLLDAVFGGSGNPKFRLDSKTAACYST